MKLLPLKFRFGLKGILLLILLISIPFSLVAGFRHRTSKNIKAISALRLKDKKYENYFEGNSISSRFMNLLLRNPKKLVSAKINWKSKIDYSKLALLENLEVLNVYYGEPGMFLHKLQVEEINLHYCYSTRGWDFSRIRNLRSLNFRSCDLIDLGGLECPSSLRSLRVTDCRDLVSVDGLKANPNIHRVELSDNGKLQNIDGLSKLSNLKELDLDCSYGLKNINGIRAEELVKLDLDSCANFKSLGDLGRFSKLEIGA